MPYRRITGRIERTLEGSLGNPHYARRSHHQQFQAFVLRTLRGDVATRIRWDRRRSIATCRQNLTNTSATTPHLRTACTMRCARATLTGRALHADENAAYQQMIEGSSNTTTHGSKPKPSPAPRSAQRCRLVSSFISASNIDLGATAGFCASKDRHRDCVEVRLAPKHYRLCAHGRSHPHPMIALPGLGAAFLEWLQTYPAIELAH